MKTEYAQVLITGGSEGIGRALAERFAAGGARVLITGRNINKLEDAAAATPGLQVLQNDIAVPVERERLAAYARQHLPRLNIVINNAGIQRRISLAEDESAWLERQQEIDILLAAPVHLNHLLLPLLLGNGDSMIVNVSSGGAYIPQVFAPVYSACKAAMHSYTMALRYSLAVTQCRVVELVPPAVQTGLGGGAPHGADLNTFADKVFDELLHSDKTVIGYGPTECLQVAINGGLQDDLFTESAEKAKIVQYE